MDDTQSSLASGDKQHSEEVHDTGETNDIKSINQVDKYGFFGGSQYTNPNKLVVFLKKISNFVKKYKSLHLL